MLIEHLKVWKLSFQKLGKAKIKMQAEFCSWCLSNVLPGYSRRMSLRPMLNVTWIMWLKHNMPHVQPIYHLWNGKPMIQMLLVKCVTYLWLVCIVLLFEPMVLLSLPASSMPCKLAPTPQSWAPHAELSAKLSGCLFQVCLVALKVQACRKPRIRKLLPDFGFPPACTFKGKFI